MPTISMFFFKNFAGDPLWREAAVAPSNITFATKPEIVLEQMRKANLYPG